MNSCSGYHGPAVDKRQEGFTLSPSDYEQKRISGVRAMQNRPSGGYRVPSNAWSGYGISHTSPASMGRQRIVGYKKVSLGNQCFVPTAVLNSSELHWVCAVVFLNVAGTNLHTFVTLQEEEIWKSPPPSFQDEMPSTSGLNTSNYLDHTPTNTISRITNSTWPDLPTMLTAMGLEKYISLFMSHEVDLSTFPSLTDADLIEMGITAIGTRRKLLLVISGKFWMSNNLGCVQK